MKPSSMWCSVYQTSHTMGAKKTTETKTIPSASRIFATARRQNGAGHQRHRRQVRLGEHRRIAKLIEDLIERLTVGQTLGNVAAQLQSNLRSQWRCPRHEMQHALDIVFCGPHMPPETALAA